MTMRDQLVRAYQKFREPGNFLRVVLLFISGSLTAHFAIHYDPDWGATNLALSIEATVASAALMVMGRKSQRDAEEARELHRQMLEALTDLARAQRDTLHDQAKHLRLLADHYAHLAMSLGAGAPLPHPPSVVTAQSPAAWPDLRG